MLEGKTSDLSDFYINMIQNISKYIKIAQNSKQNVMEGIMRKVIITNKEHIGKTNENRVYIKYDNFVDILKLFKVALRMCPDEIIVKLN